MYDRDKIKELELIVQNRGGNVCRKRMKMTVSSCNKYTYCDDCNRENYEKTIDIICEEGKWECNGICDDMREKFNISKLEFGCDACEEAIENYIKEDFQTIFNKLKK